MGPRQIQRGQQIHRHRHGRVHSKAAIALSVPYGSPQPHVSKLIKIKLINQIKFTTSFCNRTSHISNAHSHTWSKATVLAMQNRTLPSLQEVLLGSATLYPLVFCQLFIRSQHAKRIKTFPI